MPFTGNPGDGLSWHTAYQVTTLEQYEAMDTFSAGTYFKFFADIDFGGAGYGVQFWDGLNIDFNGFKVFNGVAPGATRMFRNITGELRNVWVEGPFTFTASDASLFEVTSSSGVMNGVRVDGTIQSTTGSACLFDEIRGNNVSNVICTSDIIAETGNACLVLGGPIASADKIVYTGQLSTTGTATISLSANTSLTLTNSFYDSTKNGTLSGESGATGKTTTELQALDTYTNLATTGLDQVYDMVRESSYSGTETWTIADNDGVEYPKLGFQVEEALIPSVTFKDETGTAISGALVRFFTVDAFDSKSPAFTNFTLVGSAYTTDVNGVATYDPNTDPAVDGTKVYGAIAFDAEAGSTEMEVSTGISFGRQNVDVTLP